MRFFRRKPSLPPPSVEIRVDAETTQDMAEIATTLNDLQNEMAIVSSPIEHAFKPWWLLMAIIVAVVVSASTFILVQRITDVDENTKAISEACEIRNEALRVINAKFNQLNVLFDASLATPRDPSQPPVSAEILRLYAEFKKPIPLTDCKESP